MKIIAESIILVLAVSLLIVGCGCATNKIPSPLESGADRGTSDDFIPWWAQEK